MVIPLNGATIQLRNMARLGGSPLRRRRCDDFHDTTWLAEHKRNPKSGCATRDVLNQAIATHR